MIRIASDMAVSGRHSGKISEPNNQQLAAQGTSGMQDLEVFLRKSFALEQGDGDGIAERQHHGGRGGRRQAHGAGLRHPRQQQGHIGALGQGRVRLGGHGHQRDAETAGIKDDIVEFRGVARIGHRQDRVAGRDHA
jgi:hypothetical protein